jgi:hypothetical protein
MINPQWGFNPIIKIIIRMLFAVTLFQQNIFGHDMDSTVIHCDNQVV